MTALTLDRIRAEIQRLEARQRLGALDAADRAELERLYRREAVRTCQLRTRIHHKHAKIVTLHAEIAAHEQEINA